ncbi:MAG: TonB-dependent receptor [Candidatus Zixiibacteriota bacterium]
MNTSRTSRGVAGIFYCANPATPYRIAAAVIFCFLLLVSERLTAQEIGSVTGFVYDATDGSPIARAFISIENSEAVAISGDNGAFRLVSLPVGDYRIRAEADGFEDSDWRHITLAAGTDTEVDFRLDRKIYYLGESTVTGNAAQLNRSEVAAVTREDIEKQASTTVADVLDDIDGVYVQTTGPAGSESRVSIRGCDPKHVLVLIDGQRVNTAGTGVADLSSIPLEIVDRIEVYKGGESARFGSDAVAGVIDIRTILENEYKPQISLSRNWADWQSKRLELTARDFIPSAHFSHRISISNFSAYGDFPFQYSVSPRPDLVKSYTGNRMNSEIEQTSLYGSGRYEFNPTTALSLSGQVYHSTSGMPGPVSNPDTTAWKEDNRLQANVKLESEYSPNWTQTVTIGFSRFEQYFNNLDHQQAASRFESRYINDIAKAEATHNVIPFAGNDITLGTSVERNILYHDDLLRPIASLGRTVRDNIGVFAHDRQTVQLHRQWLPDAVTLSGSVRFDNTDTRRNGTNDSEEIRHDENTSHKLTLSFVKGDDNKIILRTGYGRSFRLPEVNALFWKGDVRSAGNPDLRPEKSEHSDVGLEIHLINPVKVSMGTTYFHQYTRDLIFWQPSSPGETWKPVNLDASRVTGHEDFIELDLFDDVLALSYQNTVIAPKNRTPGGPSYNKDLTFRPRYITTWTAEVKYKGMFCRSSLRSVGRRFALAANTKWYDAYQVNDIAAGFTVPFSDFDVRVMYRLDNFNDEDYVLIGQYPMPGREWGVSVRLSYQPGLSRKAATSNME